MKKVILTLTLAVLSLIAICQTAIPTYKNTAGNWSKETEKYEFNEPWVTANITFTFYDTYITADDRGHSVYRIIEELPEYSTNDVTITTAKCLDEQNRECKVGIMVVKGNDDQTNIAVIYENKMFMYMVDIDKMRNQPKSKDLKSLN